MKCERRFVYAIRDTLTNKIINSKCNKNGKYYERVSFAKDRVESLNKKYNTDRYELVVFELTEVK